MFLRFVCFLFFSYLGRIHTAVWDFVLAHSTLPVEQFSQSQRTFWNCLDYLNNWFVTIIIIIIIIMIFIIISLCIIFDIFLWFLEVFTLLPKYSIDKKMILWNEKLVRGFGYKECCISIFERFWQSKNCYSIDVKTRITSNVNT